MRNAIIRNESDYQMKTITIKLIYIYQLKDFVTCFRQSCHIDLETSYKEVILQELDFKPKSAYLTLFLIKLFGCDLLLKSHASNFYFLLYQPANTE